MPKVSDKSPDKHSSVPHYDYHSKVCSWWSSNGPKWPLADQDASEVMTYNDMASWERSERVLDCKTMIYDSKWLEIHGEEGSLSSNGGGGRFFRFCNNKQERVFKCFCSKMPE